MSPAEQVAFTKAFVEEAGGDISKVSLSYQHADETRRKVCSDIASNVKENWIPPKLLSLHWDGKSLESLSNQYVRQERLGIAVGDCCDVKLLGVPAYETGTDEYAGHLILSKSCELLKEWGCSENVKCMVFDTTAANTGHVTAACVTVQEE